MTDYLLSLAALHAAGPGVLDKVFGPDGDFEGAPLWVPAGWEIHPLLTDPTWTPVSKGDSLVHLWLPGHGWAFRPFDELALDLRQATTAARLAGLCARALNMAAHDPGPWYWTARTTSAEFGQYGGFERWEIAGEELRPLHLRRERNAPILPAAAALSRPAFLAALTLALAPRIAALGGTHG